MHNQPPTKSTRQQNVTRS